MKLVTNFLLNLLILQLTVFSVYASEQKLISKEKNKQLVVASSNNFPPINILDDDKNLTGFARDISDAVLFELGIPAKRIHSHQWTEVLTWLKTGKADFIHDTGFTSERTEYLDFTTPIIEMPESIFVRSKQFDIFNLNDLKNKKVACVNQHITHIYLKTIKGIQCHIVNTPAEGLIALINGSVDGFVYPEQIILYLAQDLKLSDRLKTVGEPLRTLSWSMTVKKGNLELLNQLNQGIHAIKKNGKYDDVYSRWFGKHAISGYSKKEVYLIAVAAVIISLLLFVLFAVAIHNRKIHFTNELLKLSEAKYRTLVDKLPESIFLKDIHSQYISCNRRFAESLNISTEEITGKTDAELFPSRAEEYRTSDMKVMNSGNTMEFIEAYENDDGSKGYINMVKTPVYDKDNQLTGVLGFFWDISDHYNLQRKLSKTVTEYNDITATVPDIMYKLDLNGDFVWWNATFEKVTGLSPDKIKTLNALDVIESKYHDKVKVSIQKAMTDGYADIEALLLTGNGEIPYFFNGAKLTNEQGETIGLAGSGHDISNQKELQLQLLQAQKMESVGQLTGGIAHDFNNMLGSILGYSELVYDIVSKQPDSEKLVTYIQQVISSGERARDLVANMLTFARGNRGAEEQIQFDNFIDEVIGMLRPMIPSGIEINKLVSKNLPVLLADPVMLQQMLVNLAINARDAIGEQGVLSINVSQDRIDNYICNSCHHHFSGDFIIIAISDSGEGIHSDINNIFEPFFTTKEVGKGTGMGLAMVHGITHEHGGHIKVLSDKGGTSFSIYLPVSQAEENSIEDFDDIKEKKFVAVNARKNILVVDDEAMLLDYLCEMLSAKGYNVTAVNDSVKALDEFRAKPDFYDMLITDQTMPKLSGKELSIKVLEIKHDLPIIMATGYSNTIDSDSAKIIGINTFLSKPIKSEVLLSEMTRIFTSH